MSHSVTPSTSSITMAAPAGDSTYSYSRTTCGSSSAPSASASARNIAAKSWSRRSSGRRYLIATAVPVASWVASTTAPNPPAPSAFSSVYPGTVHSLKETRLSSPQEGTQKTPE
jgi:hypothetical protein